MPGFFLIVFEFMRVRREPPDDLNAHCKCARCAGKTQRNKTRAQRRFIA
jgi:hypothetical protein